MVLKMLACLLFGRPCLFVWLVLQSLDTIACSVLYLDALRLARRVLVAEVEAVVACYLFRSSTYIYLPTYLTYKVKIKLIIKRGKVNQEFPAILLFTCVLDELSRLGEKGRIGYSGWAGLFLEHVLIMMGVEVSLVGERRSGRSWERGGWISIRNGFIPNGTLIPRRGAAGTTV
jgi:hypothetical protein